MKKRQSYNCQPHLKCLRWDRTVGLDGTPLSDTTKWSNFCRQPIGQHHTFNGHCTEKELPWCYTTQNRLKYESCKIPNCLCGKTGLRYRIGIYTHISHLRLSAITEYPEYLANSFLVPRKGQPSKKKTVTIPLSLMDLYNRPTKFKKLIKFWNRNKPCSPKVCKSLCPGKSFTFPSRNDRTKRSSGRSNTPFTHKNNNQMLESVLQQLKNAMSPTVTPEEYITTTVTTAEYSTTEFSPTTTTPLTTTTVITDEYDKDLVDYEVLAEKPRKMPRVAGGTRMSPGATPWLVSLSRIAVKQPIKETYVQ